MMLENILFYRASVYVIPYLETLGFVNIRLYVCVCVNVCMYVGR